MSLVRNELRKITATWLNTMAAGSVVVGVIAPAVSISLSVDEVPGRVIAFSIIWFLLGIALHYAARAIIKRLEP